MFHEAAKAKVLKRTNIWKKFAITLCSLLLYVSGINEGQPQGIGHTDIMQWMTESSLGEMTRTQWTKAKCDEQGKS
eukprot:9397670-Karenia_brevis.AAC.1